MKRILAVARKEVFHILRDPRSLIISILMPLMMLLIFGYAIDMDLENLPVGILDRDRSPVSRDLVNSLTATESITGAGRLVSRAEIETGFRRGRFRAVLVLPRGFSRSLDTGRPAAVQVILDGADGSTAATADAYLAAGLAHYQRQRAAQHGLTTVPPVDIRMRYLFNPELESTNFVVPGLVAIVLTMICALLTSIALAREKETGTLEQLLTTPVGAGQVIVGKLTPYMLLGALDAAVVLAAGRLIFQVPMHGSWWALAGYSLIFILISLALGILVSALAASQQVAMMMALLATFLPTLLLSGFIFVHSSMPPVLQGLGQAIPATHYLEVVYGIMLRGETWFPRQLAIMLGMLVVLLLLTRRGFKVSLES
ncbi:MAG: ABC transporter permease subunit [Candidatus Eisenbacteria bacterium]|nr:ABC transporter permease subunit [Candidatus Eisenbacteria bacterium]